MKERRACIQCYKEHVQVSDCPDEAQFQRVNLHCTITCRNMHCMDVDSRTAIRARGMFVQDALKCQDAVRAYSQCAQRVFAG